MAGGTPWPRQINCALWAMLVCGGIKVDHWAVLLSKTIVPPTAGRDRLIPPAILPSRLQTSVSKGQRSTFDGSASACQHDLIFASASTLPCWVLIVRNTSKRLLFLGRQHGTSRHYHNAMRTERSRYPGNGRFVADQRGGTGAFHPRKILTAHSGRFRKIALLNAGQDPASSDLIAGYCKH